MNKFVYGALAFTMASPLFAGGSETEEWLTLDREIDSLAASLADNGQGALVTGFVKSTYSRSSDVAFGPNDLGGFNLDNAQLVIDAATGDYSWHVRADGSSDTGAGYFGNVGNVGGQVLDAWAAWNITENIKGTLGNFRPPFLGSALRNEDQLLFIDKTVNGESWDFRDLGLMLSGSMDQFGWWVAVQNGIDAQGDDLAFAARAAFNALGAGAGAGVEGAYGAPEESNLTVAAGYYQDDDTFIDDLSAFSIEAAFTHGALYAAAEIVNLDEGFTGTGDSQTPWAATVAFMFVPDAWEAALRFEDADDDFDTSMAVVGVNYYVQGHNAKWQVNYSTINSDISAAEIDVIAAGLVVGI
jgi:hypothetical protein